MTSSLVLFPSVMANFGYLYVMRQHISSWVVSKNMLTSEKYDHLNVG